ncbi:hypothetical protein QCA50_013143 [Cerrena zonata]|uniref:DNA helicase n=1 Tax=Cerrena zonata TaxID=2478898 RepID=A0AAW0FUG5_9APHY
MTQTNESHLRGFIERHRSLLAKEREAEIARTSLLLSNCGPKLLEQKGLALGGLSISNVTIGLGGKTLVELERSTTYHSSVSFPPHTFRTGDLARVEENVSSNASTKKPSKPKKDDAKRSKAPEGVVYKVSDSRIVIAIDTSDSAEELDLPERCRVLKLANSVTYDRMEKTLAQLEKIVLPDSSVCLVKSKDLSKRFSSQIVSPPASSLLRVLLGLSPPSERMPIQDLVFFDRSLNPSQQGAVRFALESPEVACIHGPPGTGKTHTLIEIIRQLTTVTPANPKPLRILICGASNLSVDNILERLLALSNSDKSNGMKLTRLGHPARVMANERSDRLYSGSESKQKRRGGVG